MAALEKEVRTIESDGLIWGPSKMLKLTLSSILYIFLQSFQTYEMVS